jgi:hypothetical protein
MKLAWIIILTTALIPISCKPGNDRPSGLMIEFIREPELIKILDSNPEFSWIVPEKSGYQSAWQIMVASTKEKLNNDIGDIWDSKKVISSISSEIEFKGNPLLENSAYFWKVRIWDSKNNVSEFSKAQFFRTGIFSNYATTRNKFQFILNKPQKIKKISGDHYFIDFGKDAFGTLILDFNPSEKDTLIVHLGEKTDGLNHIDRNPGGSIRYQKVLLPLTPGKNNYLLNLPADERNTGASAIQLPDSVGVVTPFRYCELENFNYNLKVENITQKALWYYFDDGMSSFSSSDTILNKIWDICKYSMKATSFAGYYIDGDRERIPYEADAYINQLGHYYTDREYSLGRLTNEYFIDHPTWPTEWILHTVPMFYNDFMFTGNIESVKNYYEELKFKTLIKLSREDGLISSSKVTDEIMTSLGFSNPKMRIKDIVDWPPGQKETGWKLVTPEGERDGYELVEINSVVNAFFYRNLVKMSELAGYLDNSIDSLLFINQAMKVKTSFNEKLLDKNEGIYRDGESSSHSSLHANMMALAFNLVPDEYKKTVTGFIKSRGMACSVYGSQYLLEGLYNAGESDYAFNLLTATNDRSWWNMIRSGSTITLEAWDMKYKPNSDWNHAWGAAPANIIPGYMWGIAPTQPGFSRAVIRPQLSNLKKSKISVPTIRGNINAEFTDSGISEVFVITIPANIECDFINPEIKNRTLLFNGKKIKIESENLKLIPGRNIIELERN